MLCFIHAPDNDIRRTGMPEYLAPGVCVEETGFRSKSIAGVSTRTAGFVGPACKGPTTGTPKQLTCSGDFERSYGCYENLLFSGGEAINYIANAVKNDMTHPAHQQSHAVISLRHDD
jgi:phage tail sheath protein FI